MTAHQFHHVRCSLGARHWFPLSASMSVYPRNRTKWPPITRTIDLRWWWRLLDKASLFQRALVLFWARDGGKNESVNSKTALLTWEGKFHSYWIPKHGLVLDRDGSGKGSAEMTRSDTNSGLNCSAVFENKLHRLNLFFLPLPSVDCVLVLIFFFATCANMQARQTPCGDFCQLKKPDSSIIPRFLVD